MNEVQSGDGVPESEQSELPPDEDFELALHTSGREAFTGFSNLGAMSLPVSGELRRPWKHSAG
jgi:hypothetical protein